MIQLSISEKVLFRELDGEAVILATETGRYYGLNAVGTRMWNLLAAHRDLERVWQELVQEFDASDGRLREDLVVFVETLKRQGLLKPV